MQLPRPLAHPVDVVLERPPRHQRDADEEAGKEDKEELAGKALTLQPPLPICRTGEGELLLHRYPSPSVGRGVARRARVRAFYGIGHVTFTPSPRPTPARSVPPSPCRPDQARRRSPVPAGGPSPQRSSGLAGGRRGPSARCRQ